MPFKLPTGSAALLACSLVLAEWPPAASARDYAVGTLEVHNPWTRATPKGLDIAGAYLAIENKGTETDRLIGGSTAVSTGFQVHSLVMDNGVAKMRPVEGGLEIKPGETVELKPGSFHVMLLGLKQPLVQGQRVKGTLIFEKAGPVDVEFPVESIGSPGSAAAPGHPGH